MTQRLSGLDAAFLTLDTATSTGHVAGLSILRPQQGGSPPTLARLSERIAARLHEVPVLRQRLIDVPLRLDQPVWSDDEHFDLGYHLREIGLPSPGSSAQLSELVGRLHARALDRDRPLWEAYLITGLDGGDFALYTKVHHAAIDGVSGAELLTILFDLAPEPPPFGPPQPWEPEAPPDRRSLGVRALVRLARRPVDAARLGADVVAGVMPALPSKLAAWSGLGARQEATDADGRDPGGHGPASLLAPHTPFNAAISPHRRFAFATLPMSELFAVKRGFGTSLNEVVLSLCAAALRSWLLRHDALPEEPLVAMVPVSIGTPSARSAGNDVSAMLVALPTHLDDPVERLTFAHRRSTSAKDTHQLLPDDFFDQASALTPPVLLSGLTRAFFAAGTLERLPAFNTVVSNVPGPNFPVYLDGALLTGYYPVSVVTDGVGLNITVVGYDGGLHVGLVAARELMPDLEEVLVWMQDELAALGAAAEAQRTT